MKVFIRFLISIISLSIMAGYSFAADGNKVRVAAISGYFAQGFGVSIVDGLNRAKQEFDIDLKLVDTGNRSLDYEEQFSNLARDGDYDLIFVMGWELVDSLVKASQTYPEQQFVFIDGVLESDKIIYANFAEEQGSFIAGALAALVEDLGGEFDKISGSKAIGFVGGSDIPVIRNFLGGYEQGARYAVPGTNVMAVFAGAFDDPAKGSELAMALYGQGVDIIYNVAGPTGEGGMQASSVVDKYSIGVDVDMCATAPGNVLASMLKRGDIAVYSIIKDEVEGRRVSAGIHNFDLASGGVEVKLCDDVAAKLPASITAKLEEIRTQILAGEINIVKAK